MPKWEAGWAVAVVVAVAVPVVIAGASPTALPPCDATATSSPPPLPVLTLLLFGWGASLSSCICVSACCNNIPRVSVGVICSGTAVCAATLPSVVVLGLAPVYRWSSELKHNTQTNTGKPHVLPTSVGAHTHIQEQLCSARHAYEVTRRRERVCARARALSAAERGAASTSICV